MGCRLGKAELKTAVGFQVILVYKSLVTRDDVPDLFWSTSIKFSKHMKAPPPILCSLASWWASNGRNASVHPGDNRGSDPSFLMKDSDFCPFSVIRRSSLIGSFTLVTFCSVATVTGRPQRSQSSNVGLLKWNSLFQFLAADCDGDWSPKQFDKLWKLCWKGFPWH